MHSFSFRNNVSITRVGCCTAHVQKCPNYYHCYVYIFTTARDYRLQMSKGGAHQEYPIAEYHDELCINSASLRFPQIYTYIRMYMYPRIWIPGSSAIGSEVTQLGLLRPHLQLYAWRSLPCRLAKHLPLSVASCMLTGEGRYLDNFWGTGGPGVPTHFFIKQTLKGIIF